ncbi:hypothetical protein SEPCBS119000_005418 [Sporothrix epigloea]|uniref:CST complex subunit Ten1 n=1 Tax=Sporothrix epigloea TaxID=1892477 RepID=A0ABP0DXI9_9PEZI
MAAVPASEICFLSDLVKKKPGQKVRFLGCVTEYDLASGILTMQHQYQNRHTPHRTDVRARVHIDLVLERLTAEQTSVGAWINVLGYVADAVDTGDIHIQAVLLWSTGPLNLQEYERQLSSMMESNSASRT